MSLYSRITNIFRRREIDRSFDEELQAHIDEAIASGRNPEEVRRATGSALRHRENSRAIRIAPWLDALASDIVFGFRQLRKNRVTSAAAILSLALAIGACTSAFRLIDAVLLCPLPVAEPDRLKYLVYEYVAYNGQIDENSVFSYPLFRKLRDSARPYGDLFGMSGALSFGVSFAGAPSEKIHLQYVSGDAFSQLGLQPALGRLLFPSDDLKPGAHPVMVISYEFWTRRFGQDPRVIGSKARFGEQITEIIGVAPKGFTGTDIGAFTDIWYPAMMNTKAIENNQWIWFPIWARLKPGVSEKQLRESMQAVFADHQREYAKRPDVPRELRLSLQDASRGISGFQDHYRRPLWILGIIVVLVLLIACANVANLLIAQAAARQREMALRISIGAGRARLMQLMLIESALVALIASILGSLFAWWSAPFVVSMLGTNDAPIQLVLQADWRVTIFGIVLASFVTFLFGITPALRASAVKPNTALKGGDDPRSKHRTVYSLIAAQVGFSTVVLFIAGLFVTTFRNLANQPLGFSSEHVLILETATRLNKQQSEEKWHQIEERLRTIPGVESVARSSWPLMYGYKMAIGIWIPGRAHDNYEPSMLAVSPSFFETMRIQLIAGQIFRRSDQLGVVVNEAFAKRYFEGQNPVGRMIGWKMNDMREPKKVPIVGYVKNARYQDLRREIPATLYLPSFEEDDWSSFEVRTAGDPMQLASILRNIPSQVNPEFRVVSVTTQSAIVERWLIRERLLAVLSVFFAVVALVLAGIGLYGVLNYSVIQRRREIGIRMALGARAAHVASSVTTQTMLVLLFGLALGLAVGVASTRYIESLLFGVQASDPQMIALPLATLAAIALIATLPPVLRAIRIDPAEVLRSE